MRSPNPCRSAVPLSALFAFLLVCLPAAAAQTAPPPAASDAATPPASVQLSPLPDTEQFSKKIDFRTRPAGESLDALVQILARSVGLSAVTQGIPNTVVRYDFGEPKPFREVWNIVLTLNGLEYVLRDNNIVVVGPPAALVGLQPPEDAARPRLSRTYVVNGNPTELQTLLESQFPAGSGVTVSAFEELKLISVRATAEQQALVRSTLDRFDQSGAVSVRRTYALSYARAEELAEVLEVTLTTPSGTSVSSGSAFSPAQAPQDQDTANAPADPNAQNTGDSQAATLVDEGQFSVAADVRSNSVVVTAPTSVQNDIAALIVELDQPERQVNVQVRIQEVTTGISERLGIDLTSAVGNFSTSLFSGDEASGLSFIFDAQRAVTGFNLGAVLDAFEQQNLARRVDDSNITVLNNGEANLQAGGTIFISIPGVDANIERTIPYGVQIDLVPQITASDEILLTVTGKVEAVVSETDNPNFLELSTRSLTSQVSLGLGQTVVLGGLLQSEATGTTRKVPGLGNIPVVGNLFSTNNTSETDTELLVIVTANVLE